MKKVVYSPNFNANFDGHNIEDVGYVPFGYIDDADGFLHALTPEYYNALERLGYTDDDIMVATSNCPFIILDTDSEDFFEGNKLTFKINVTNGYDSLESEFTVEPNFATFEKVKMYSFLMKETIQSIGNHYVKVDTNAVSNTEVKSGNASEKQREIMLRNGYTNEQIDRMSQKEASETVKSIFKNLKR